MKQKQRQSFEEKILAEYSCVDEVIKSDVSPKYTFKLKKGFYVIQMAYGDRVIISEQMGFNTQSDLSFYLQRATKISKSEADKYRNPRITILKEPFEILQAHVDANIMNADYDRLVLELSKIDNREMAILDTLITLKNNRKELKKALKETFNKQISKEE